MGKPTKKLLIKVGLSFALFEKAIYIKISMLTPEHQVFKTKYCWVLTIGQR